MQKKWLENIEFFASIDAKKWKSVHKLLPTYIEFTDFLKNAAQFRKKNLRVPNIYLYMILEWTFFAILAYMV